MAIDFIPVSSVNATNIDENFRRVRAAMEDAVSRKGSVPNQMLADLDLNNNDLLNVDRIDVKEFWLDGIKGGAIRWHSGGTPPTDNIGFVGDWFLHSPSGDVYGPKTAGGWGAPVANITGPAGPQGVQGIKGDTGSPGATGPKGDKGERGDKGDKGDRGLTGATGATGERGPQGLQGVKGDTGPQGVQGIRGPIGIKGDTGATGPAGVQGNPGPQGPIGPDGPLGPQGAQGIQGPQGPKGDSFSPDAVGLTTDRALYNAELKGFSFLDTQAGYLYFKLSNTSGDWSNGAAFTTGPQGPLGPQGDVGPQGEQGIQGVQGIQGPQGIQGERGPAGVDGAQGPEGPEGAQGLKGDQGDPGPKGDKGDTGGPGPKGDKGDTGEKGDRGDTGPKGDTGDTGPKGDKGDPGVPPADVVRTSVQTLTSVEKTQARTNIGASSFVPDSSQSIELHRLGAGDRNAYIDFHSADGGADYHARILRSGGLNGKLQILQTGTGNIEISGGSDLTYKGKSLATKDEVVVKANDTGLGGFTSALGADGNSPAGYTPSPVGSNFKHIGNTGAFTFNAPTLAGEYTMVISVENGATAGAITFAGFSVPPIGDAYDTTAGRRWVFTITKVSDRKLIAITRAS